MTLEPFDPAAVLRLAAEYRAANAVYELLLKKRQELSDELRSSTAKSNKRVRLRVLRRWHCITRSSIFRRPILGDTIR